MSCARRLHDGGASVIVHKQFACAGQRAAGAHQQAQSRQPHHHTDEALQRAGRGGMGPLCGAAKTTVPLKSALTLNLTLTLPLTLTLYIALILWTLNTKTLNIPAGGGVRMRAQRVGGARGGGGALPGAGPARENKPEPQLRLWPALQRQLRGRPGAIPRLSPGTTCAGALRTSGSPSVA